jgi:hypothetical protein
MQDAPETSREERRVINAIRDLSEAESQIAICKTIDEVEEIRLRCQAIQHYDRQHAENMGPMLVAWAKRCAVKCQLRITELQDLAKQKRNGEFQRIARLNSEQTIQVVEGELTNASKFATPTQEVRASEARLVASLPPEELDEHLKTSGSVQLIARKVRKSRGKKELKSTPAELESARNRKIRAKQKKLADQPPPPKLSPIDRFRRYWIQEEKLLLQFFVISDLPSIEGYWTREFQAYRTDAEAGTRERNEALAKLKNTTARETDAGVSDVKNIA